MSTRARKSAFSKARRSAFSAWREMPRPITGYSVYCRGRSLWAALVTLHAGPVLRVTVTHRPCSQFETWHETTRRSLARMSRKVIAAARKRALELDRELGWTEEAEAQ